jgi:hypothetical protein
MTQINTDKNYIRDGNVSTFPSVCYNTDYIPFILIEMFTFLKNSFHISLMKMSLLMAEIIGNGKELETKKMQIASFDSMIRLLAMTLLRQGFGGQATVRACGNDFLTSNGANNQIREASFAIPISVSYIPYSLSINNYK